MGRSKSYRGAPGWESQNTPRGKYTYSTGDIAKPEGTHMNKDGDGTRNVGKVGHNARAKSSSHKASGRNSGPYGES